MIHAIKGVINLRFKGLVLDKFLYAYITARDCMTNCDIETIAVHFFVSPVGETEGIYVINSVKTKHPTTGGPDDNGAKQLMASILTPITHI